MIQLINSSSDIFICRFIEVLDLVYRKLCFLLLLDYFMNYVWRVGLKSDLRRNFQKNNKIHDINEIAIVI